jgi:hypothetical protein
MRFYSGMTALVAAMLLVSAVSIAPVAAQDYGVPAYTSWQADWDAYHFDKHHVILGTVASFAPYRLTVARRNGNVQTVDLKNHTIIYPTGATPTSGERVALVGYYSNGTFIANRVILHP